MPIPTIEDAQLDRWLPTVGKPARYTGHEWNAVRKPWDEVSVRMVLAYPDTYEVGMSNLGLQILYDAVNRHSDALCERAFAPWPDMEATMRGQGIPLYALESRRPLAQFDLIGFSLPYELNLTNVLNMLDLARLPIRSSERTADAPLVLAGGSGAYHPEPMAAFVDAFFVGEADRAILELLQAVHRARQAGAAKYETLRQLAQIPGVYVPRFYKATYDAQGRQNGLQPLLPEAQMPVIKQQIDPLPPAPTSLIVPYVQPVHDRGVIEIMRGCTQGCRFCQAGMIYRPLRERDKDEIVHTVQEIVRHTGHSDIGLISLSSADHTQIRETIQEILALRESAQDAICPAAALDAPISVSLPSLRTDAFSVELAQLFTGMRRSGLTFAPEAGSQRLRDVINKKVTEHDLLRAVETAYANRWQRVKLYFMIGLPTETDEDVQAIVDLVRQVAEIGYHHHGRKANVSVTVSTFVPKPHTPFQWHPLIDEDTLRARQRLLRQGLRPRSSRARNIRLSYHDARISLLEAILARGGRELGPVLEQAWRAGARFDAWDEQLRWDAWSSAFAAAAFDVMAEAQRARHEGEWLPWEHISCGVTQRYLWREYEHAAQAQTTRDCREGCTNCGARELIDCRGEPTTAVSDNSPLHQRTPVAPPEPPPNQREDCLPRRVRIVFRKGELVKYISNLDLLRAWERILRRARLPLAYTQGFNPHPRITIAMPLAVGCSGENEVLDVLLDREDEDAPDLAPKVLDALEPAMPPGISVVSVTEVPRRGPALATHFAHARYRIALSGIDRAEVESRVIELLGKSEVRVQFRRKPFDLRPLVGSLALLPTLSEEPDVIHLDAVLLRDERGRTGRPDVLAQALELEPYVRQMVRQELVFNL